MHYSVTKQITKKTKIPGAGVYAFLIGLFAIPVIFIAFLSMMVYAFLLWLKQLFVKKPAPLADDPYFIELNLLSNEHIKITVVEDEADKELTGLNELWEAIAYHDQTYLYRARTTPLLPGIDGKIVCFYLKERSGGAIMQLVSADQSGQLSTTQLIYLQYNNITITPVDEAGLFHLYNDDSDQELIRGFNNEQEIRIYLEKID